MRRWRLASQWALLIGGASVACVGLSALVLSGLTPEGPTRDTWSWVVVGCYGAGLVLLLWPEVPVSAFHVPEVQRRSWFGLPASHCP